MTRMFDILDGLHQAHVALFAFGIVAVMILSFLKLLLPGSSGNLARNIESGRKHIYLLGFGLLLLILLVMVCAKTIGHE